MSYFSDHYQQGFYQEVYDDLLAMQEHVFDEAIYPQAVSVAKTIMQRVRFNIELLIPRLKSLGYQFVDGYLMAFGQKYSPEEQARINELFRTFRAPPVGTSHLLDTLEERVGVLPVSLKSWYEEIGSVNLVGTFPATKDHDELTVILDPLFVFSLDMLVEQFTMASQEGEAVKLPLAPDSDFKYGYGGGGPYTMKVPCRTFDAPFEMGSKAPTFVNYLRSCFQWGGFFGLSEANINQRLPLRRRALSPEELAFLTKDLLPF